MRKGLTVFKYLFPAGMIGYVTWIQRDWVLSCVILMELLLIIEVSELVVRSHRVIGMVLNDILMLLLNAQILVLIFGNSYISMIMLSNLGSLRGLQGKAHVYIAGIIGVVLCSLLPIISLRRSESRKVWPMISVTLALELMLTLHFGNAYSPLYSYRLLYDSARQTAQRMNKIRKGTEFSNGFYRADVTSFIDRPQSIPEKPNIILIFTEGLSQNIIDDSRNLMPNVARYQASSLSFANYYNHTFATYRGLIGQLYSGYQYNNNDSNTLTSIQSILKDNGYKTAFINPEPNNLSFCTYLNSFQFDAVIGEPGHYHGQDITTLSDREMFDRLLEEAENMAEDGPFFLAAYTFGTHESNDSPELKYGDGSEAELNKFYNLDHWFGSFMDTLAQSSLADDTIVVFTTDHATYRDLYYTKAFPNVDRPFEEVDTIPLFIHYFGNSKGRVIDVGGRNSLDLAPTILDYIDISGENFFLGTSLFSERDGYGHDFDTLFDDTFRSVFTKNNILSELSEEEKKLYDERLNEYYGLSMGLTGF